MKIYWHLFFVLASVLTISCSSTKQPAQEGIALRSTSFTSAEFDIEMQKAAPIVDPNFGVDSVEVGTTLVHITFDGTYEYKMGLIFHKPSGEVEVLLIPIVYSAQDPIYGHVKESLQQTDSGAWSFELQVFDDNHNFSEVIPMPAKGSGDTYTYEFSSMDQGKTWTVTRRNQISK